MAAGIEYRVMRAEDNEVCTDIYNEYLFNDPIIRVVPTPPFDVPREVAAYVNPTMARCIEDGIGMVAVDKSSGEIVGIRVSYLVSRGTEIIYDYPEDNPDTLTLHDYAVFLDQVWEGTDVFTQYGVDRYAMFRGLAVKHSHRQRGIASQLLQESFKLVSKLGLKVVVAEAMSIHSGKAFDTAGFKQIKIMEFAKFEYKGRQRFPNPGVNKWQSLHIKTL